MKMNKLLRALSLTLCLALLLPAAFALPGAAAEPEAMEMYHFVASATVTDNIKAISSNNINTKGDRYPQMARPAYVMTKYTEKGPVVTPTAGFTEYVTVSSTYGTYGLPYSDSTAMGKRITENLAIVPEDMGLLITKGKEVVNVELDYVFRSTTKARNVAFDDMMEVFVSLDGETWLPDSVGMRCYVVDAPGLDHQGNPVVFYKIQSENLLDIDGVEPGDRIHKIKIMPDGTDNRVQTGHFIISEMRVNGYKTRAEFEQLHPVRKQFLYVEPDTLRQIVVDEGVRAATIQWNSDYDMFSCNPGSSSTLGGQGTGKTWSKDITWQGMIYERNSDAFRERHHAYIVDGMHVAGYAGDSLVGMDCQTFAYDLVSRVSRTNANGVVYWMGASGARLMDGTKHPDRPTWTDIDIKPYNTAQEMYEIYAKSKPGDVPFVYQSTGGVHVRVVSGVDVVRNPDGTINGAKSIMYNTEQTSAVAYEIRMPDGSQYRLEDTTEEGMERFLAEHPGAELMYAHCSYVDNAVTFEKMYSGSYTMATLDVYDDGMVELEDTQIKFMGKNGTDYVKTGAAIAYASNYTIIRWDVKLEDAGTGAILFEDGAYMKDNCTRCYTYTSDALDAVLKNLTNGDYRLSFSVDAGPLTKIGQSQVPVTTKTEEFSITDKPATTKVSVNAPTSAAKGEEVTVQVQVSKAYDAADVEIKYDQDQLTYVSGTVAVDAPFRQLVDNKGVVRIACVDAKASSGTLATLTFKAKDACKPGEAITVKNAMVTTAADANNGTADKAVDAKPCTSVNMNDVAANAWYHKAVDYALENNLMSGYNASTFGPNDKLSRAMVVQVLYNKEGKPALTAGHAFPDVKSGDWYNSAVAWAAANKVVGGYGDGRFGPNDNVTLEQIAVILHNYTGTPEGTGVATELGAHSDWAANALAWADGIDLFQGVPYNAVTETATRAQTAQLLMNYLSK